jgi:hypothetical protein
MAMLKQSGGGPFYKTGPLYVTSDPIDPSKKKAAEKEAKTKAEKSATEAKKVYGKSTTTTERFKDDRGAGTKTTVTTPYTRSGKGSAEFNTAYGAAKKAGKKTFDYGGKLIKVEDSASRSGKDVKSTVKYDPIKTVGLKTQPPKLTTPGPKAPMPKIKTPEKPYVPSAFGGTGRTTGIKVKAPEGGVKRKKAGGGNSCGCKY